MASTYTRRQLLRSSAALGCTIAAHPLITPIAMAQTGGQARLVVIVLRGAMDGLDVFRPVGDPDYLRLRPSFGTEGLPLDNFFTLHPALVGLHPLWAAGELAFVPATSTLYRDARSHFDGQDHLEAGTAGTLPSTLSRDGWLNRMIARLPGATARTAFAVGHDRMLILDGQAPMTQWAPGTELELGPQAQLLLSYLFAQDPLFAENGLAALAMGQPASMEGDEDDMAPAPLGDAATLARYVAQQLQADTRIAAFSLNGWDTHRDQHRALLPALNRLETAILTLRAELGALWGSTTVMAMTEFGRTAAENGAKGTDHGTGGALVLAGGALRGGRAIGGWPGLAEANLYDRRDLMPLSDIRRYPAWAMRDLFGLSRADIEGPVFTGLDMGTSPGLFL
jgi:uncharacterized protein (DUF1501 family)